ncbi:(5-formylfuran-3-yl)methyl phosphate synthase [Methylolobus aquaticus]
MTGFLASVRNLEEARIAAAAAVDILDLKAPQHGALGALDVADVTEIVRRLGDSQCISATIGDLPLEPARILTATRAMAATGVDYVKLGFFPGGDLAGTLSALEPLARSGPQLVAVLFGDHPPSAELPRMLARAGFAGCMLDTADKTRGSLTEICSLQSLSRFVTEVRSQGLLCGLAGSLRTEDIPALLPLQPDYLGFRGALCRGHQRTQRIDPGLLQDIGMAVRGNIDKPSERTRGFPVMAPASPLSPVEI